MGHTTIVYATLDALRREVAEGKAPEVLGFMHMLRRVADPFRTPDGVPVQPRHYGFREHETGGGCRALLLIDETGTEVLVTNQYGEDVPDEAGRGGWLMGGYAPGTGDEIWRVTVYGTGAVLVEIAEGEGA